MVVLRVLFSLIFTLLLWVIVFPILTILMIVWIVLVKGSVERVWSIVSGLFTP